MQRKRPRSIFLYGLFFLAFAASTSAAGQEESAPDADSEAVEDVDTDELDLEEARQHFEQAVALYQAEDYEAALVEFRASYELNPIPQVLFNIAVTLHDLDRVIEAMDTLDVYLEQATDEPGERRAQAHNLYVRLSELLATVSINCGEDGAEITVDDESQGRTPLPNPLRFLAGSYRLELSLEGYRPYQQLLEVTGGQELTLDIDLEPLPEPWLKRRWWVLVAAGSSVLVVGIIIIIAVAASRPDGAEFDVIVEQGGNT